ncbi:Conserved oligomeric Golgi complex subunit 5 [Toxocara canis]|uniref:Conserved oligomeric Golgi complex subunit 5 n=1 Tax=Toxocara canis TaxID=6265 RepID=A0A0B2VQF0_TOXCA|nr:Conserved oligomeric Golgi complex subunit 5 [Toxocara canis]
MMGRASPSKETTCATFAMSLERDLEDVIWGKKDWNEYVTQLVQSDALDEHILLERIELVKDSIGRQLRKAVEQNHSRLVEQAGALQGLDAAREVICSEMNHLHASAEILSSRFSGVYEELETNARTLERLYAVSRIVTALNRCEKLLGRLNLLNELVRRTEAICELEAIVAKTPSLSDVSRMRETILEIIPRIARESRRSTVEQLKSSMQTMHAPMVQSCVRALRNLNCYDAKMRLLLEEEAAKLDAAFLKLSTHPNTATKSLPQLASDVQTTLEQFSLLGSDMAKSICGQIANVIRVRVPENAPYACRVVQHIVERTTLEQFSLLGSDMAKSICGQIANVIRVRVPENAPYACRVVQHMTHVLKRTIATDVQPIRDALEPLKRGLLSHALSNMFEAVNEAFQDPSMPSAVVEKVSGAVREQLMSVNWDIDLGNEMELNIGKVMELCAQKVEQMLVLDDAALQVGEHISSVQALNYALLNVAHSLSAQWNRFSRPLVRVMDGAREAIVRVAHTSVRTILLSLHSEPLGSPSPYARELYNYLVAFSQHVALIEPFMLVYRTLHHFVTHVIEMFLLSATLLRPVESAQLTLLAADLLYVADALRTFNVSVPMLVHVDELASALLFTPEELVGAFVLPFWAVVQLLISQCEPTILSPPESAGWTRLEYIKWFMGHTNLERFKFFKSLMDFYTLSVVSDNRTEFVCNYHYILEVLNMAFTRPELSDPTVTSVEE